MTGSWATLSKTQTEEYPLPPIAETIAIRRRGQHLTLFVEGKEFPWRVAADDLLITRSTRGPGTVTLTIPAMRIVLDDEAGPEVPECGKHIPVQHRDGRARWCDRCGLTADGSDPGAAWRRPVRQLMASGFRTNTRRMHKLRDELFAEGTELKGQGDQQPTARLAITPSTTRRSRTPRTAPTTLTASLPSTTTRTSRKIRRTSATPTCSATRAGGGGTATAGLGDQVVPDRW